MPRYICMGYTVTAGGYRELCRGRVGYVAGGGFWGGSKRLNAEDNEGMYLMIEVRPEEYKGELGLDIALNRRDMKSMFGYIMLGETQLLK